MKSARCLHRRLEARRARLAIESKDSLSQQATLAAAFKRSVWAMQPRLPSNVGYYACRILVWR